MYLDCLLLIQSSIHSSYSIFSLYCYFQFICFQFQLCIPLYVRYFLLFLSVSCLYFQFYCLYIYINIIGLQRFYRGFYQWYSCICCTLFSVTSYFLILVVDLLIVLVLYSGFAYGVYLLLFFLKIWNCAMFACAPFKIFPENHHSGTQSWSFR